MLRKKDARALSAPYGQIDPRSGDSKSERAIVTKTWEQQAADALPTPGRHPYQSQSVAFAVRTAEAFASCSSSSSLGPTQLEASACAPPLSDKTSICCQLLKELTQVCPELAIPIGRIRDALGQALYSNYFAAADGTLELRQLPYFTVVERLELEKANLQQKYEDSRKMSAAHEEHSQELAWQLAEAQRRIGDARREYDQLSASIEQHLQKVTDAEREAVVAREELKGARKEVVRMRNEGASLRALYDVASAKAAEQSALADQRLAARNAELADALEALADMVPKTELRTAVQEAESMRADLSELEGHFAGMQEEHARSQQDLQTRVHELTMQREEAGICAAQQLAQVAGLLSPEPVSGPVALLEVTHSLGCTFAVGLGLGAEVPAFLRWRGKLALHAYSAQETEAHVQSILRGQMTAGEQLRLYLLHMSWDFVREECSHLIAVCSRQVLMSGEQDHQQSSNGNTDEGSITGCLEEIQSRLDNLAAAGLQAAQAAYSLVHAAQQAAPQSTDAMWFLQQLNGRVPPWGVPDTSGLIEALDLAKAVQVKFPHRTISL